jgi:hypothetical protein
MRLTSSITLAFACLASASAAPPPEAIKVTPGATTTIERQHRPASGMEAFTVVAAQAGQYLLAELNNSPEATMDETAKVAVYAPGGRTPVPSMYKDDAYARWIGRLERSGDYRIEARPEEAAKYWALRVTLMDPHDPRLDPGLAPAGLHLDLAAMKIAAKPVMKPFWPAVGQSLDEFWPAHLALIGDRQEIRVMAVAGFEKTLWVGGDGARRVATLRAAIEPGAKLPSPRLLPGHVNIEADITFMVRQQAIESPTLRGVRWIGFYEQDDTPPVNPLTYAVDAISRDGRFLIMIRLPISHPGVSVVLPNAEGSVLKTGRAMAARRMNDAAPASFNPSLDKLDAWVRSISLPH